ncbi:hypothetical protein HDU87_008729 [Geranomyces variabilis]|uniref:Uncharacterized protein n=1 Tax=Geranomyces variabilis TaxID=109894 RepID=A0AAD5XLY8_9FUNG|nr:hypothetical protein HDU87_008729 [Geranomyces variabilis]
MDPSYHDTMRIHQPAPPPERPDELDWSNVAIASTLILSNIFLSLLFGLGLEKQLIVAATRCLVQLTIMGHILQPVFDKESPLFVAMLTLLLISIAILEISFNRTKFRHDYMVSTVALSTITAVLLTSFVGNALAFGASPWYRPRTYIPTVGMLLGNCMSAQAVGLNTIMGQASDNKERIEMYLSFGATRWEAARPLVVEAIRTALLPVLNSMSVMGLISIPGMMTGQIMGGSSIGDAVRYQQILIFMISSSSTIGTIASCMSCCFIIFDDCDRLRLDRIRDTRKKPKASETPGGANVGSWWDETTRQDAAGHIFQVINTDDATIGSNTTGNSSTTTNSTSSSSTSTSSSAADTTTTDDSAANNGIFNPTAVLHAASTAYASASHLAGVAADNIRHAAAELSEAAHELKETVMGSEEVDDGDDIGVL